MSQIPIDPAEDLEASVRALVQASLATNTQIEDLKSRLRQRTFVFLAAIVVALLVLGIAVSAAYQVSLNNRRAIEVNNGKFCPVVLGIAPRPGDPPPTGTPEQIQRSVRVRTAFTKLVNDFDCQETP